MIQVMKSNNVKKDVKIVLDGTVSLSGKANHLIEDAMLGYREERLRLVEVGL